MKAIGVAISTRDRPESLARCLHALATGDTLPDEVVIVDQSRTDATLRVVEAFQARGLQIARIPQVARGLGAAQNAAVLAATTPIVAITDDDCLPDRRWLTTISEAFAAAPGLDVLTGRVLAASPSGEKRLPVSTRVSTTRREFRRACAPWHVGSGNNFALRRESYLRIGGCDERLGPGSPGQGGVDMDLFYRLLRAGASIRYEPEALVLHERQTETDRRIRRPMYGHGMGACFGFWLRQRDLTAIRVAGEWILLRLGRMVRSPDVDRRTAIREELQILNATARGLMYGLSAPER